MSWLYETIGRSRDVELVLIAAALSVLGAFAAQCILLVRLPRRARATLWLPLLASLVLGTCICTTYCLTVVGSSGLDPTQDFSADALAMALATAGAMAATLVGLKPQAHYREVLLAGAILAGSVSCTVFVGLESLARPYRLAYDLLPVTLTVLGSAVLGSLGIAQWGRASSLSQRLQAACYLGAVQTITNIAGLVSIAGFGDFLTESDKPVSLATEPFVVVLASCSLVVVLLAAAGTVVDHHLSLRARRESDRLRQLADSTSEGIVIHRGGIILDVNAAFSRLVGRLDRDLRGQTLDPLFLLQDGHLVSCDQPEGPDASSSRNLDLLSSDGTLVPVEVVARRILYTDAPASVLAVRDLRERRLAEERIRHLANHDALTGLPNRSLLGDQARHALQLAQRSGGTAAFLCLDLDRFKAVNDTMGHAAGDLLLRQVSVRLRSVLRECDIVSRIGGDEFVIVQEGAGAQPQAAAALAKRLVDEICIPFDLAGQQACIGTSVGIALYPDDGLTPEVLFKNADVALYRAKAAGRSNFQLYEVGMDHHLRERQGFEADLRAAVGTSQIQLHYQPLFGCNGEGIFGFEALMRWTHPTRGVVSPVDFIPLAEETGLIIPLGLWALKTACQAAVSWPCDARVAVNVSAAQFRGDGLPQAVDAVIALSGLAPERLELEITESMLMSDTDHALRILNRLKSLGVRIALDDFGTGYSSLSYLRRFPFDKLKIDRSFVSSVADDEGARSIVEAILALGKSLHLHVTAEGVETSEQLAVLQEGSCNTVQGFLLGKPMTADHVSVFLASRASMTQLHAIPPRLGGQSPVT